MANKYVKSAKDLAFDKERASLKKQIREAENEWKEERRTRIRETEELKKQVEQLTHDNLALKEAMEKAGASNKTIEEYLAVYNKGAKAADTILRMSSALGGFYG